MMLVLIPLAALLVASAPTQDVGDGGANAASIASFLGEEVAAVAHVDLTKGDVPTLVRRVVGKLADEEDVKDAVAAANGWVESLKKAGARDLFLLLDPADLPGHPVAVVPLAGGADASAIARLLTGRPVRWPASETIRGAVVAGSPAALARVRDAQPAPRPELAAALTAGEEAAVQFVVLPSTIQRRAIEESAATLAPELGGGPITTLTQGLRWASFAMMLEPRPTLRATLQARDAGAAQALLKLAQGGLDFLANEGRRDSALAPVAAAIGQMKPELNGDRITVGADLEKSAELLAMPIRRAREAARRSQCVNNLKQIGLAMHNYHSTHNTFPAAYSASPDGKPLLSWRVHILPYLEQKALYDEFHLDEPWDSPHNKALISRMPRTYACPSGSRAVAREGKTSYLTPRGPATIFPGAQAIRIKEITDGTSNTILVVDASDSAAVIWTRPDDWEVPPDFKTRGLFGHHPSGTNFTFADGSVRFLKETIAPRLVQALVTRNGGEVISSDDY
jgi:prepilin-type processing-associated H-X9-DG protein